MVRFLGDNGAREGSRWVAACALAAAWAAAPAQDIASELTPERALEYDPHYLPALLGLELIQRGGLQGL